MILFSSFMFVLLFGLSSYHVEAQTSITKITDCEGSVFDIVFVLDSSGSVGYDNFTVMKSFVKSIIQNLEIGPDQTKVGLITFSRYPSIRIRLGAYSDKTSLLAAVDQVPYIPGITETQNAIELLKQEGFKNGRPNAPHVSVVITDGKSFHTQQTAAAAESARNSGITLFAIGIGTEINIPELNSIGTDPDSNHVYTVSNFASLTNIVNSLTAKTCTAPVVTVQTPPPGNTPTAPPVITQVNQTSGNCNRTLADIVFVLDSSGSLGLLNFTSVKKFVISVVNYLDIGKDYTKVGVITFSNYPNRRITLDQYTDKLDLVNAINNIPYFPGNTETDKALEMLRFEGFEGDRPNAPNIAIIVTDGLSTNPGLTKIAASEVKKNGTTVFSIGIGVEIDTEELKFISSDPDSSFVFFVSNFSSLSNIVNQVARTTCDVPLMTTTVRTVPPTPVSTVFHTPTTKLPTTTQAPTTPQMTTPSCVARVADVMFVVDTSGSVGEDNLAKIKAFMKQTISVFDIATDYTRIGVITYSTNATVRFPLDQYNTSTNIYSAIDKVPYSHGGTNTAAALEMLRTTGFAPDRFDAPNIAIVITDGLSKDSDATKLQAELAKNNNITIIAIGIGNLTDDAELLNMATVDPKTNKSLVYRVGDFAALQTLNNTVATVACGFVLPPAVIPTTAPVTTEQAGCHDKIPNCDEYGDDICYDYQPWAKGHCALRCGFCEGPSTTPMPCVNRLSNCQEYGTYICTSASLIAWTKKNCPEYCGICGGGQIPTEPPKVTSTPPAVTNQVCGNKLSNCHEYQDDICTNSAYNAWSHKNCAQFCGFCSNYVDYKGQTISNNVTCPDWKLPSECTLTPSTGSCCPMPNCPDGFTLTAKSFSQQ